LPSIGPAFAVTFQGRDIFSISVPRSGLSYSPEYGWREAARWAHMDHAAFQELDGDEQSAIVAHWQCSMQADAVIAQHQAEKQRRAQRRGRKGPR
jgi:hypothetical protein